MERSFTQRSNVVSRKTLSRSLMLVVVTVALFSVAGLLGRWHWVPDLLSHLVAHYALLTALASIGLLWCGRPGWAILAAGTCVLQIAQLVPYLPSTRSSVVDAPSFKVFQFNVGAHADTHDALFDWIETRADELDVVVLFEVDKSWENPIRRLAGLFFVSTSELRDDPFGIAVFTQFPGARAHIEHAVPFQLQPSVIVSVAGDSTWPPITILASHAPAPTNAPAWRVRNSQFAALAEVARGQEGEVLLVGDLNTTVWSAWYRDLKRRSGLRDAQVGHGYRATWAPYRLPLVSGLPLDQLLISEGLISVDRTYPPRMSSDHRPIVTTLAVRPRRD